MVAFILSTNIYPEIAQCIHVESQHGFRFRWSSPFKHQQMGSPLVQVTVNFGNAL